MPLSLRGKWCFVFLLFGSLAASQAFSQATFSVSSSNRIAADIGLTELTGAIKLTILSGGSVSGSFAIRYSAPITNNSVYEILVSGSGALSQTPLNPELQRESNTILVKVPAGGFFGDYLRIVGVRVAVATDSRVTAVITSATAAGNSIAVGQNETTVIESSRAPIIVDVVTDPPLQVTNGVVVKGFSSFTVAETYGDDFTSDVNNVGQTVPTMLRINPFPPLPPGVKVTYNVLAGSTQSEATFTTLSGAPETVPRADGSTSVTYKFSAGKDSAVTMESFRFYVSMELVPGAAVKNTTVQFQATLMPVGVAVPNEDNPSTDIPRYIERKVPEDTELSTGSIELAFPFRGSADGLYTGIAITNPQDFGVKTTLSAYDETGVLIYGSDVTNPVTVTLPNKGQMAKLITELFGSSINVGRLGTVRAKANTSLLVGFYLQGSVGFGPKLDGAVADLPASLSWTWPRVFAQGPSPFTVLEMFNPSSEAAAVGLTLFDATGKSLGTASVDVAAGGAFARDVRQIFAGATFPTTDGGYVLARSNVALVARESFGNSLESNVLPAQIPFQQRIYHIGHFASGGGYKTELTFVNDDVAIPGSISLTLLGENGIPLPIAGNPGKVLVAPGAQLIGTLDTIFPALPAGLSTGYIKVEVEPYFTGPFVGVPAISGALRFSSSDGAASATLPLFVAPANELYYSHIAQQTVGGISYYTGIALVNINSTVETVLIEVYSRAGIKVGYHSVSLQPGQKFSKLLYELVPASKGQAGGYVHVVANKPVLSFSLFGTADGRSLSAIPPQQPPVN